METIKQTSMPNITGQNTKLHLTIVSYKKFVSLRCAEQPTDLLTNFGAGRRNVLKIGAVTRETTCSSSRLIKTGVNPTVKDKSSLSRLCISKITENIGSQN